MSECRARLLDIQIQEQERKLAATRKSQVSTGDRSAKIRTYNFPQGRVTDHRIGLTLYRLQDVMEGGLDELVDGLRNAETAERLAAAGSAEGGAFESRIAISGLMPDFPWMTLLSVWRVTPRILAPSVTDSAKGSRQALLTIRPGCAGFFIGMVVAPFIALVVVDQFNVKCIRALKAEDNSPVRPHRNRPKTL